uniref:Cystatin domain-containing protein n=1 Tax=Panagrolaimus sp. ES5 TaxID=591445 RepID=A0AC34F3N6_9BILA
MFLRVFLLISCVSAFSNGRISSEIDGPLKDHDYVHDIVTKYNNESADSYYYIPYQIISLETQHSGNDYAYSIRAEMAKTNCLKNKVSADSLLLCIEASGQKFSPADSRKVTNVKIWISGERYDIYFSHVNK